METAASVQQRLRWPGHGRNIRLGPSVWQDGYGRAVRSHGGELRRCAQTQPKPKAHDSVVHLTKQPDGSYAVPLTLTQEVP